MGHAKQTIVITKTTRKRKTNNNTKTVGKSKRCPKCGRYM